MKSNKRYWIDLAGYLTGEMDKEQQHAFRRKMEMNRSLNNDYKLMKRTWDDFQSNPDAKYKNTGPAWETLKNRIETETIPDDGMRTGISNLNYFIRIAAVIALILAIGIPSIYYTATNGRIARNSIEHKSRQGVLTVDLPDGSRVFLNEGSSLEVNKTYEEERNVLLKGEGFFDIMSDPARPFKVNTGKVVVTVLGTSFNVKEIKNERTEVFVESGEVKVEMKENKESLLLKPGEMGSATTHLSSSTLTDSNYLSWKTKNFKFVDQDLETILRVLENAYHVNVESDIASLGNMRLTTTYSNQSFEAILSTICTALNMSYQKEGKVYILHAN